MNKDKIIKVHVNAEDKDYYFGCIAGIYEVIPHADIRISARRLYIVKLPYKNKYCTITEECVHRKSGNKGGDRRK